MLLFALFTEICSLKIAITSSLFFIFQKATHQECAENEFLGMYTS